MSEDKKIPIFSDLDIYHFKEGSHYNLYEKLGSKVLEEGTYFALWAPNAKAVSVVGDFNSWNDVSNFLKRRDDDSGIWEVVVKNAKKGDAYKFYIETQDGSFMLKSDPYGLFWENPPKSATKIYDLNYEWKDSTWISSRGSKNALNAPISIYELHLNSWKKAQDGEDLNYKEIAKELIPYLKKSGFTHIELLPITEHPFEGSWGYQGVGYFAPTSRMGKPEDFMNFVDLMHQNEIGVILDWVPSHFVVDMHGLCKFDGTNLYEHEDPRQGFHPDWGSAIFNFGRNEVKEFLISSALFWFEKYHIDGIRVDAVASMLYLDYSRKDGEWVANRYGGRENIEAIEFLQTLNAVVYERYPDVLMIAEESTAWPNVTKPTYIGGLGFELKWNMGFMHDSLKYFSSDPIYRKYNHDKITFSMWYAFDENFLLSYSHDEVVHGKGSMINKMPGDYWQKFANLRALYAYMFAHPGKKLLFMGGEFAQFKEWDYKSGLDFNLFNYPSHKGVFELISSLNSFYKSTPEMYKYDFERRGFEWVISDDFENSVLAFLRFGDSESETTLIVCNLTPVVRHNYRVGVPYLKYWSEVLNTDSEAFFGSNVGNFGGVFSDNIAYHNQNYSISITLPPLSVLYFKPKF